MSGTRYCTGRCCWCSWAGGGRGRRCPGLMCQGVVFVKTAPLMTPRPFSNSRPLPPSLQQHPSIWKPFAGFPQRKFRLDHLQHLLSVYLPAALNPLDKLKQGNCRATGHFGPLRTGASAVFPINKYIRIREDAQYFNVCFSRRCCARRLKNACSADKW